MRQVPAVSDKDMSLIMSEHSAVFADFLFSCLINFYVCSEKTSRNLTVPVAYDVPVALATFKIFD